jgi:hypothetical protein
MSILRRLRATTHPPQRLGVVKYGLRANRRSPSARIATPRHHHQKEADDQFAASLVPAFKVQRAVRRGPELHLISMPIRSGQCQDHVKASKQFQLGVVADDAVEVELQQGQHRLSNGSNLFLNIVLVIEG